MLFSDSDVPGKGNINEAAHRHQSMKGTGKGWGGVWTATDDFLHKRRKTGWTQHSRKKNVVSMPPRLYVDYETLIWEVPDVCELRRGDHGLIAINVVRCLSPALDRIVSFLGSIELTYIYHHFTVMDDVSYVDDHGVPCAHSGRPVEVVEYANTIPEFYEELRVGTAGSLFQFPFAVVRGLLDKAKCHRVALADYGDSPHLYVVTECLGDNYRDHIYREALQLEKHHRPYNCVFNNCEHTANQIHKGKFTSPNVRFMFGACFRSLLCLVGLFFLDVIAASCDSGVCIRLPTWPAVCFYTFTALPVGLQAIIRLAMTIHTVNHHRVNALIDYNDYYHLLAKELGRAIFVGGGAMSLISVVPRIVLFTQYQYFAIMCAVCLFAYVSFDLLFNCLSHAVMRLVFLPFFGKVWLIECAGTLKKAA
jgi:hypothetical protein